ncbi:hypothetical protein BU26DRAFT_113857 [Trematosphaeria pertusa]|uniref:Uncharacterized protein n=1 Tax=Trematosphaeria pertusa TaxID=390896 RepID=A0A6A6I0Z4_9PLEO|nr:uncharacterized protein BU26DRAFT_113857 [Trematosphaeria pertusa]KAF2243240.1 hypothetical protein BU26DRAFT_113857 [Trematosphaeria pertusa]
MFILFKAIRPAVALDCAAFPRNGKWMSHALCTTTPQRAFPSRLPSFPSLSTNIPKRLSLRFAHALSMARYHHSTLHNRNNAPRATRAATSRPACAPSTPTSTWANKQSINPIIPCNSLSETISSRLPPRPVHIKHIYCFGMPKMPFAHRYRAAFFDSPFARRTRPDRTDLSCPALRPRGRGGGVFSHPSRRTALGAPHAFI